MASSTIVREVSSIGRSYKLGRDDLERCFVAILQLF